MRIDGSSLIAAQSAPLPSQPANRTPQVADKPLFEPINFPRAEAAQPPAKASVTTQSLPRRLGSQLDIKV
jgi:hypothetical protein